MTAVVQFLESAVKGWLRMDLVPAQSEPAYGKPREMTGFFAGLTEDQKKQALAYTGEETHGDRKFRRK